MSDPYDPDTITCRCFADAAALGLELHDLFGRYHAVLLLDDEGSNVDFHVFTEGEHRISHAVCVAHALGAWLPRITRAVLFSEVDEIAELNEDDARLWHVLGASLGDTGIELLDWIQTDEHRVRSLTISCDAEPVWQRLDPGWDRV